MGKVVALGCGRRIGLGHYVKAWKACLALSAGTSVGRGVSGYGDTAGEALAELRRGLHDRINRHLPWYGKGRKWSHDWERAMGIGARALNTPRLIIRWLPEDLMKVERFRERVEYGRSVW